MFMFRPFALTAAIGLTLSAALADQPPTDARPVVEIVEQLERQGYGPFTEISFDDGVWEVEVYKDDVSCELAVDPKSAKVLSEHRDDAEPRPPREALSLSRLLRQVEQAGYESISEVSFERRYWEIESFRSDGKHEIHVNPATGEVVNDRLDC